MFNKEDSKSLITRRYSFLSWDVMVHVSERSCSVHLVLHSNLPVGLGLSLCNSAWITCRSAGELWIMITLHEDYATGFVRGLFLFNLSVWLYFLCTHKVRQFGDFRIALLTLVALLYSNVERRSIDIISSVEKGDIAWNSLHFSVVLASSPVAVWVVTRHALVACEAAVSALHWGAFALHFHDWLSSMDCGKLGDRHCRVLHARKERTLACFDPRRPLTESRLIVHLTGWCHARRELAIAVDRVLTWLRGSPVSKSIL